MSLEILQVFEILTHNSYKEWLIYFGSFLLFDLTVL